eukprot:gb/GFBE01034867.1/.p1 GENE.gb/GFBE01034867.1/~~gb/GFBE01034867.1/.p1  ORF type:complete len:517 (+),score=60.03 gb/GFBE01034867.1/:1-1551(+)
MADHPAWDGKRGEEEQRHAATHYAGETRDLALAARGQCRDAKHGHGGYMGGAYFELSTRSLGPYESSASVSDQASEGLYLSDDEDKNSIVGEAAEFSLRVHQCHVSNDELRRVTGPLRIPGCRQAAQLAVAVSRDSEDVRHTIDFHCSVGLGQLHVASDDSTFTVPLIGAQAELAPCGSGHSVIAIVPISEPQSDGVEQDADEEQDNWFNSPGAQGDESADVKGWIFVCPAESTSKVMETLSANGCFRTGMASKISLDVTGKVVGGSCCMVLRGERLCGGPVAAKRLKKKVPFHSVAEEVELLVLAQANPRIATLRECFYETDSPRPQYTLIFDYYAYGDLYDRVSDGLLMTECEAMSPFRDLLLALRHLHEHEIFHRDVKPENILIERPGHVVLTDFGIATLVTNKEKLQETYGTVGYASPEMLLGKSTGPEGDNWSAGIVLYFMLSKSTPFIASTPEQVKTNSCRGIVNMNYSCFDHLTDDCRMLIRSLIKVNVQERLTAAVALTLPVVRARLA